MSGLNEMLSELRAKMEEKMNADRVPFLGDPEDEAQLLRVAYAQLSAPNELTVGSLAVYRPGMKDLKFPAEGQPVVVTGFNPGAIEPEEDSGSNTFRRPCDMRIGVFVGSGDFSEFWVDARRFMPYVEGKT